MPRVVGSVRNDDQPGWHSYNCGLSRSGTVSGRITDDDGKPLADVKVHFMNVGIGAGQDAMIRPGIYIQDRCRRPL